MIKNKVIRKLLKIIANWDSCPAEYQRNFSKDLMIFVSMIFSVAAVILSFLSIIIALS